MLPHYFPRFFPLLHLISAFSLSSNPSFVYHHPLTPNLLVYSLFPLLTLISSLLLHHSSKLIHSNPSLSCPPISPLIPYPTLPHSHTQTHTPLSLFLSCLSKLAQAQLSRGFESQWERLGQSVLFTPSDVLKRWRDQTPLLYCHTSVTCHTHIHTVLHTHVHTNSHKPSIQTIAQICTYSQHGRAHSQIHTHLNIHIYTHTHTHRYSPRHPLLH